MLPIFARRLNASLVMFKVGEGELCLVDGAIEALQLKMNDGAAHILDRVRQVRLPCNGEADVAQARNDHGGIIGVARLGLGLVGCIPGQKSYPSRAIPISSWSIRLVFNLATSRCSASRESTEQFPCSSFIDIPVAGTKGSLAVAFHVSQVVLAAAA